MKQTTMQVNMFRRISKVYNSEEPYYRLVFNDMIGFRFHGQCYLFGRDAQRLIESTFKNEVNNS